MGWLTKILKGLSSGDKNSRKHHRGYEDEEIWECPPTAVDTLSDFDSEEIDRAIALSLLEEDAKSTVSVVEDEEDTKSTNFVVEDEDDDDDAHDHDHDDDDDEDDHHHDHDDDDDERSFSSEEENDQTQAVSSPEDDETGSTSLSEEEDDKGKKVIDHDANIEEDEQLAKSLQETLHVDSPPRNDYGNVIPPLPFFYSGGYRICVGCNAEIGHGRFLNCLGGLWHPECFRCHACNSPISDYEVKLYSISAV